MGVCRLIDLLMLLGIGLILLGIGLIINVSEHRRQLWIEAVAPHFGAPHLGVYIGTQRGSLRNMWDDRMKCTVHVYQFALEICMQPNFFRPRAHRTVIPYSQIVRLDDYGTTDVKLSVADKPDWCYTLRLQGVLSEALQVICPEELARIKGTHLIALVRE